jgi:hypothetical protein
MRVAMRPVYSWPHLFVITGHTIMPPYPLIQYPRFTAAPLLNLKIKETNGS